MPASSQRVAVGHGAHCTGIDRALTVIFDPDRVEDSVSHCSCGPDEGFPVLCDMYEHELWSPDPLCAGPFTRQDYDKDVNGLMRYAVPLES